MAVSSSKGPDSGRGESRILSLSAGVAGSRLDLFLATELSLSRAQVRRLLDARAVALDGRTLSLADKGMAVGARGQLEIAAFTAPQNQRAIPAPADRPGPVTLASGSGWVALDKPPGMPVHPLRETEEGTLLSHAIARYPQIQGVGEGGLRSGVVHRLDVDTSGVVLVAHEEKVWQRLRAAFQEHRVEKEYLALVEGRPDWSGGGQLMTAWLAVSRHRPAQVRVVADSESMAGRARQTSQHVCLLEEFGETSLVQVRPRTGFLHQIRATLSDLGHPLVGDLRYGAKAGYLDAERHMLHARRVAFEEIQAESPVAPDFDRILKKLRGG